MHDSILNTDAFDRRRFGQLYEMSKKMKQINLEGRGMLPSFLPLMGDIWAGLFKMKPELLIDFDPNLRINHQLMERMMQEQSFQEFREFTRLDDLSSALGTIQYSGTVLEWIEERAQRDKQLSESLKQALNGDNNALQQAAQAMGQALKQNGQELAAALAQAAEEAKQTKANLNALLGGIQAGNEKGELSKVPLRDQLALAEKLSSLPKLKDIAEWAGRLKLIAQKKQRSKHKESIAKSGITQGNQVENLLPVELAAFGSPMAKLDFMRRFVEGQTLQFDSKGKETLGKGPIVLCLDQSGSMENQDTISKGFALALMSIARKQRRDFALILFDRSALSPKIYERGKISVENMVDLATIFLGGGTDFYPPLMAASKVIETSRFNEADVVFVTDGESSVSGQFIQQWNELKKTKNFRVLSLLLGTQRDSSVRQFSDQVIKASSFYDEAVHQAFEI